MFNSSTWPGMESRAASWVRKARAKLETSEVWKGIAVLDMIYPCVPIETRWSPFRAGTGKRCQSIKSEQV